MYRRQKNIKPEFMTFALPTKKSAHKNLEGATHPSDKTCRPQIMRKKSIINFTVF